MSNAPPPEFLDFQKLAASFTWDSYQSSVPDELSKEEYQTTNDPAVRDAWWEEARTITRLPGLKRCYRDDATQATSCYILEAYNMTRYIYGTYRQPVSYTRSDNERTTAFRRIIARSRPYTDGDVTNALNAELREAFAGMAWNSETYLYQLLGERKESELNLTMLICGVRIGVAEEVLFGLRGRITASSDGTR